MTAIENLSSQQQTSRAKHVTCTDQSNVYTSDHWMITFLLAQVEKQIIHSWMPLLPLTVHLWGVLSLLSAMWGTTKELSLTNRSVCFSKTEKNLRTPNPKSAFCMKAFTNCSGQKYYSCAREKWSITHNITQIKYSTINMCQCSKPWITLTLKPLLCF